MRGGLFAGGLEAISAPFFDPLCASPFSNAEGESERRNTCKISYPAQVTAP